MTIIKNKGVVFMKNYIVSIFMIILISINIISCDKQNATKPTEDNNIKSEEKKLVDINEASKDALIQNANKYFDINIKKEGFNYYISEDLDDDEILDESEKEEKDDLSQEYIIANAKDSNEESGVSSIDMDYNKDTNIIDYMKVVKFEGIDETITLTMETAIPIAEKFIYDKNLIPLNTKLKPEAITNNKGMAVMEFSYVLDGRSDDIKIGINSLNKEVRMFEID